MSKGIKVSPKHGLNPCMSICFWCGKEKNEIALLGKLPGDKEAPRSAVVDMEPCPKCKERMDLGITILEGTPTPMREGIPKFHGAYPTGRWAVVKKESVAEEYRAHKVMYASPEDFNQLFQGAS